MKLSHENHLNELINRKIANKCGQKVNKIHQRGEIQFDRMHSEKNNRFKTLTTDIIKIDEKSRVL